MTSEQHNGAAGPAAGAAQGPGHDHEHQPGHGHGPDSGHDHGKNQGPGLGRGLISGLATTARAMTRHTHTAEYPDVKPDLPPRSRGVIALLAENCTSCMLCARECPDWCIYIESHKEEVPVSGPADGPAKTRQKNMLDRFAIDFSLCMYCGICIEVCPFDALFWSPEFEYAEFDIRDLLHESDRLEGWMASVPPPPLPDPAAVEAKEVGVARAAAEKAIAAYEASQAAAREAERPEAEVYPPQEETRRMPAVADEEAESESSPTSKSTDETAVLPPLTDTTKVLPAATGPQETDQDQKGRGTEDDPPQRDAR